MFEFFFYGADSWGTFLLIGHLYPRQLQVAEFGLKGVIVEIQGLWLGDRVFITVTYQVYGLTFGFI